MNKKLSVYLGIILFIASFMRLWQIGSVPEGVSNDEAAYGYASLGIAETLRGLDGTFLPISFQFDNSFAPVHAYIASPFVALFGLSPFSLRLPFALLGIGSVLLLYAVVKKLFNNDLLAYCSTFVLAVSPWHTHMTRIVYDGPITFFTLLWLFLFLRYKDTGRAWISLPAFFLAFYSYHATKLFLIPFSLFLFVLYAKDLFKHKSGAFLYIAGILVVILSFFFVLFSHDVTRQNVFLWNHPEEASKLVNWERDKSLAPFSVRSIFSNKLLYYLRVFRERYLEAFSLQYLFLYGETSGLGGLYGTFYRGQMYFFELPLLLYGLYRFVLKKRSEEKLVLFGGLLLAPLPSSFAFDSSYAFRSIMMVPFLSIITAYGLSEAVSTFQSGHRFLKRFFPVALFFLYVLFIVSYLYQYHFRYPVYAGESWFKSSKDLSLKIDSLKKSYEHVIVAEAGSMYVFQYGLFTKKPFTIIRDAWNMDYPKEIENVAIIPRCREIVSPDFSDGNFLPGTLYIVPERCHKHIIPDSTITDIGDPIRVLWKLYDIDKKR